jgi:hypothetical protein
MRRTIVTTLLLTLLTAQTRAQAASDSCRIRIGLLTCSPGTELYSTFGHSALRITDSANGTDIVYNYGVFDFYDPQFYTKFVRGKLLYFLDRENFGDFLRSYEYEDRTVSEQVLQIDCARKAEIRRFLDENLRPENRSYKYDFLFDNCTTRLRDLILGHAGPAAATGSILQSQDRTFRDHIHHYLDRNRMHWSKLGIDILLGSPLDRPMTNHQAMFLPDYLETGIDSTKNGTAPLVASKQLHYGQKSPPSEDRAALPPTTVVFGAVAALLAWASAWKGKRMTAATLALCDFLLFFLSGAVGLLLVFMWTSTDHQVCRNNLNLLWAIPTHLAAAFLIRKPSRWASAYFLATSIAAALLLATWNFLPQRLNPALAIPVAMLAWRAWALSRKNTQEQA